MKRCCFTETDSCVRVAHRYRSECLCIRTVVSRMFQACSKLEPQKLQSVPTSPLNCCCNEGMFFSKPSPGECVCACVFVWHGDSYKAAAIVFLPLIVLFSSASKVIETNENPRCLWWLVLHQKRLFSLTWDHLGLSMLSRQCVLA